MDAAGLKRLLGEEAARLGFAAAGVTDLAPFTTTRRRALAAVGEGRMAGMPWFSPERIESAADLRRRFSWGRSIIALAWPYSPAVSPRRPAETAPGKGRVPAYATLDPEYHALLGERCDRLVAALRATDPALRAKRFIDHGWAFDRAIAERAGIGFCGKNTQLITRTAGSYVLLASIVVSAEMPADQPSRKACGTCRECLPACPTGALLAPGVIDAPRCISYLTIEHRGPIPLELRPLMGTWAFGCDLCQEACPINERLAPTPLGEPPSLDLASCLELDDAGFERQFAGTSIHRTGRAGLARNCAIALGNAGDAAAVPVLQRAAAADPDPVVREAALWALDRLGAG